MLKDRWFLKFTERKWARDHPYEMWSCVLRRVFLLDDYEEHHLLQSQEAARFLKEYEGYFVRCDAIIVRLVRVKEPPEFSCVSINDNYFDYFSLGKVFDIYLPLPHPLPEKLAYPYLRL